MKCYIAVDKNKVIWGIGHTKQESRLDAINNMRC